MGRTVLYILIGVSVVGALAVLLLLAPMESADPIADSIAPIESSSEAEQLPGNAQEVPATEIQAQPDVTTDDPPAPMPVAISTDGTIVSGEYPHQTTIAGVDVYWSNDADTLFVGLVSPGTGYVSIGFDPVRRMEGANFILASVHEGELTMRDDYGHESLAHMEDAARGGQDNILLAKGNEWPDQTVVEFVIPLDSGDPNDKALVPGQEVTVLVAYHAMIDSFSNRHTRRGSGSIQLDSVP